MRNYVKRKIWPLFLRRNGLDKGEGFPNAFMKDKMLAFPDRPYRPEAAAVSYPLCLFPLPHSRYSDHNTSTHASGDLANLWQSSDSYAVVGGGVGVGGGRRYTGVPVPSSHASLDKCSAEQTKSHFHGIQSVCARPCPSSCSTTSVSPSGSKSATSSSSDT